MYMSMRRRGSATTRAARPGGRGRAGLRAVASCVAGALVALAVQAPAHAQWVGTEAAATRGLLTEAYITGTGSGQAVTGGYIAPSIDLDAYPAQLPAGSVPHAVDFAGTIRVADTSTPARTGLTYCIDLETDTATGVNYELGDWDESNVPNLRYVEYILLHYYPGGDIPAGSTAAAEAAAVQSAIWYFTDDFVLDPSVALPTFRNRVAEIVNTAIASGGVDEPEEPELEVTPSLVYVPNDGRIVGPFRVTGTVESTLQTNGVEVFTDRAGTQQLQNGAVVRPGDVLWARSVSTTTPQGFVLSHVSQVRAGTVLLYDGTNPPRTAAQKLILAQDIELTVHGGAELRPYAVGSLRIDKTIEGTGAGYQGEVVIEVSCVNANTALNRRYTVTFQGGLDAGLHSRTLTDVPAGSTCTITETANGDNELVNLAADPVISPAEPIAVVAGQTGIVSVTDSYDRATGGVEVEKVIKGPRAGDQGEIVLSLDCAGTEFDRTFTIPAGTKAGTYLQQAVTGIPTLTRCVVREVRNGDAADDGLEARVRIRPKYVTIRDGEVARVTVTDVYVDCLDEKDWGADEGPTFPS